MYSNHVADQRLRELKVEMRALELEIENLSCEESGLAVQRDINRLAERLAGCQEAWKGRVNQRGARKGKVSRSVQAVLGSDPEAMLSLPGIPNDMRFSEVIQMLPPGLASTPASLRDEYDELVAEGCDDALEAVLDDLHIELMCGLLDRTTFDPEQLNALQESLLRSLARRLVMHALGKQAQAAV